MKSMNFALAVLFALAVSYFSQSSVAAPITWGPATTISADGDVLTAGTSVFAYNWANSTQTVNGQAFTAPSTGVTLSNTTHVNTGAFTSTANPFASLSSAYKSILVGAAYNSTNGSEATVTLNNLTAGHSYAVQHWVNDPRNINQARAATLRGTGGNQVTLAYPANSNGTPGQFSIGIFEAAATTQSYNVAGNPTTPPHANALQLRDVTNIGAWVGSGGGIWDADTTANFADNLYSDALNATTFDTAKAALGSVVFGDKYWDNGTANDVTQTAVTIAAGGVSAGSARFTSTLDYTLSSSDATGLTGTTALVKGGSGKLTMSGTNSYTGGTGVGGGVLEFANGSLGSSGGIVVNGGTLRWASGNTENISGRLVMESGGTATLDTNGNNVTFTSGIGSSSTSDLIKTGAGTLRLNAVLNNTGTTTINEGRLQLHSAGVLTHAGGDFMIGNGASLAITAEGFNGRYDFSNKTFEYGAAGGGEIYLEYLSGTQNLNWVFQGDGNTFKTNGGEQNTISGWSSAASMNINNKQAVFDVARGTDAAADLVVSVNLVNSSAAGAVTKNGDGILSLTAANSFTGTTTVNAGTLDVSGSLVGAVTVNTGATLSGTGTLGGGATVNSGATLSPGASPGTMTIGGDLTLNDADLAIDIWGDENHDLITFSSGSLILSGDTTITVDLNETFNPDIDDSFTIITGFTEQTGSWAGVSVVNAPPEWTAAGKSFRIDEGSVMLTVIPEPNTLGLLLVIGCAAFIRRLRMR